MLPKWRQHRLPARRWRKALRDAGFHNRATRQKLGDKRRAWLLLSGSDAWRLTEPDRDPALVSRASKPRDRKDVRVAAARHSNLQILHSRNNNRDQAVKVSLQNLLDSPLIAFTCGFSRCWSVL